MISREELREIAKMQGDGSYFVSLYLNTNPLTNPKGEYTIWLKNAVKDAQERFGKDEARKFETDLREIEDYVRGNKRGFKKGFVYLISSPSGFRVQYDLAVPVKNELAIDRTPFLKPLLDILDNYGRYAVLLVDKELARIFVIHLGEITEYGEMRHPDVPGRHKKGGWFALAQNHFERHIEHHVKHHLKDVVSKVDLFLRGEGIDRLIMAGPEEAVTKAREMLPRPVAGMVVATASAEPYDTGQALYERLEPVIAGYESGREQAQVGELVKRAMKGEKAVVGLDGVLKALQEGRIMRLLVERDFVSKGNRCAACGALWTKEEAACPYCGGESEPVKYIVDYVAQKTVEHDGLVEVVSRGGELQKAGSIGAFLRF